MCALAFSTEDRVARLAFDRPGSLNALSPEMLERLIEVCGELSTNQSVDVVTVTGEGTCFSAGADLPAFLSRLTGGKGAETADLGRRATEALAALPQVTIAAVHGHCVGGGLVLAGACDLRVAADDARFLIPELEAGIPLAWGGTAHLARLVGETMAADLILSCRPFDAAEAYRIGLVSRVLPREGFDQAVAELEANVAGKASIVLRATKRQLLAVRAGTFDARSDAEALLAALADAEAQRQGMDYVRKRLRKR